MKKAIVTVNIGVDVNSWAEFSHPSFKTYAQKIGADFIIFDRQKFPNRHPVYEKFQIRDLVDNGYQRIMYIDTDAFIKPDCPDIFKIVPYEKIGGVYDNENNEPTNPERTEQLQQLLGNIGWEKGYINTGVYVVSDLHREIFNILDKVPDGVWVDQNIINYNIHKFGFEIFKLDTKFNALYIHGYRINIEICDADAYIIHFAACDKRKERLNFLFEKYLK